MPSLMHGEGSRENLTTYVGPNMKGAISAAIADSGNGEIPGARHAIAGSSGASTCHMTMCLDRRALAPGTFVSNRPAETVESGSCQMPDWGLQRVLPYTHA
jgi:hypothetical protein